MTKQGRIHLPGRPWMDCEFSFSEAETGYVIHISRPVVLTLAVLKTDQSRPAPTRPASQAHEIRPNTDLARRLQNIPRTVSEFLERAKHHPILGTGKHWLDIQTTFRDVEPEQRVCEYPDCERPVTSVTGKYCSKAHKQAAYRLRNDVTSVTTVTDGRKAA